MSKKLLRHSIHIRHRWATNVTTFDFQVSCPFTPDEVKVKQLVFSSGVGPGHYVGMFVFHCPTITGFTGVPLGCALDPIVSFTGHAFPMRDNPTGTHTITVRTADGQPIDATDADLNILLEFRKRV